MKNNREVGAEYEKQAALYLKGMGYQVIAGNFRCREGEIDLIAKDGKYLVFVEVKYRSGSRMGEPQEAVDRKKQRKISRAAAYYCLRNRISQQQPCRFDVAAYLHGEWTVIQNAFDYQP